MVKTKNNKKRFLGVAIAAIGLLTIAILLAFAASGNGGGVIDRNAEGNGNGEEVTITASAVTNSINYQGRLTDSAGNPLTGTYTIALKLYDVASGGTALDTDTHSVEVTDGLFNTEIDFDGYHFNGRALWLGIKVGADSEMTPRQELRPVPYALGLKPGACVRSDSATTALTASNLAGGYGLYAYSADNIALRAHNSPIVLFPTPEGMIGVYAYGSDIGVYGQSDGHAGYFAGNGFFSGNVGIGTSSPSHKLHVVNFDSPIAGLFETTKSDGNTNALAVFADRNNTGDNKGLYIAVRNNGAGDAYSIHSHGKDAVMYHEGNVGIGTKSPGQKLTVRGNILIESASTGMAVVELGEGLDYAEGFDVSDKTEIAPGTVLIIDPDNPGKLTISHEPYDSKVAGIVAGANGSGSGVKLGSDQFDYDVALAGRVYCNVDATEASVEPGDLLTTSVTPGYAMKVTDYERAPGAILGKAMERLEEGERGQILVLVTLQ